MSTKSWAPWRLVSDMVVGIEECELHCLTLMVMVKCYGVGLIPLVVRRVNYKKAMTAIYAHVCWCPASIQRKAMRGNARLERLLSAITCYLRDSPSLLSVL